MWMSVVLWCALAASLRAETGRDAWLRYAPLDENTARGYRQRLPAAVAAFGDSPVVETAREEFLRGLRSMLGRTPRLETGWPKESAIVLGTLEALGPDAGGPLPSEAFRLRWATRGPLRHLIIAGADPRGVLSGVFALLRRIALHQPIAPLDEQQAPYAPVRWVNEWNNLDGSIERGYGGRSIFFENDAVREDLTRASEYARLLASLGIQGCAVNNVNANPRVLSPEFLPQLARLAAVFRPWGVRIAVSVDFGSPKTIGGLGTFDPLDVRVAAWWQAKAQE